MKLLYDVSHQWSIYLNSCVAELASEAIEAPGANIPFSLETILVDLEGGGAMWDRYFRAHWWTFLKDRGRPEAALALAATEMATSEAAVVAETEQR